MTRALRFTLSFAALAVVLWFAAPQDVGDALRAAHPGWIACAIICLLAQIWLSALRWQITAQALDLPVSRRFALREYGLSVAANTFLPGGVLGDLSRILRARHLGWRNAAASVVIERLAGQVALAVAALIGLNIWLGPWPTALIVALALCLCTVLAWSFPKAARLAQQVWTAPGLWRAHLVLTIAILVLNLTGFWAAARAVGLALDIGAALALIPLTLLAMLVPLTINGWGLREGLAALLWPLMGIATAQAVAASLAFGLTCMLAALLGLLSLLLPTDTNAQPAPECNSTPPVRGHDNQRTNG